MKAVVFQGVGDIRLQEMPEPRIENPSDAIVRITASAICGTDLHLVRGTVPGMEPGTILGHEAVGVVEELGTAVRNFDIGDRVVIPSTIACGYCVYCRAGYFSQCDNANPKGRLAGTAFYGGPQMTGPFAGLQAAHARIPFANVGMVKLPPEVSDDQAIVLSDIFPTAYFGAKMADITPGDTVAVFGCGPVGQFAIASAKLMRAGRILAIDAIASRLARARMQGAEIIDFSHEDPVEAVRELTGGIGVDRAIEAVGVDAFAPQDGQGRADGGSRHNGDWEPGNAPSQALIWTVDALAKAGTLGIIGVYPEKHQSFPIGQAMGKNLTIKMGNCNHRKYIPELLNLVRSGTVNPELVITQSEPLVSAITAYQQFDKRREGWLKVKLEPEGAGAESSQVQQVSS
jgi:threonine dehydrogenase-like Zn-dependent dehydrogenase